MNLLCAIHLLNDDPGEQPAVTIIGGLPVCRAHVSTAARKAPPDQAWVRIQGEWLERDQRRSME